MIIDKKFIGRIVKNNNYNKTIVGYYLKMSDKAKSLDDRTFFKEKANRLMECNAVWHLAKYRGSRVKNFLKTNLCKDKLGCANCRKVVQAQRMNKFIPLLKKYDNDLYFITVTVPNVQGEFLNYEVNKIIKAYKDLIYILGTKRKVGQDLKKRFNCKGSIRSLEVSWKQEGSKRFHHHIHGAMVLEGYQMGKKYKSNRYSIDHTHKDKELKLFSVDEILIQKIWYLLVNDIEVNEKHLTYCPHPYYVDSEVIEDGKKVIKKIKKFKMDKNLGYSCSIEKFKPGQYQEMFKYMIKEKSMEGDMMDDETFEFMYYGLKDVRQIEGYGVFYGLKDVKDQDFENEVSRIADEFINYLNSIETPIMITESPTQALFDTKYTYVSKKKIYGYLRQAMMEKEFKDSHIGNVNENYINSVEVNDKVWSSHVFDDLIKDLVKEDDEKLKIRRKVVQEVDFRVNNRFEMPERLVANINSEVDRIYKEKNTTPLVKVVSTINI
jgi:hypothetical protein